MTSLGISVGHRELFQALECGWLRPHWPGDGVPLCANGGYVDHPADGAQERPNNIPVHLDFDAAPLPAVAVTDTSTARHVPSDAIAAGSTVLWPGALPMFALSALTTGTEEHAARLRALMRNFSNIATHAQLRIAAVDQVSPPADLTPVGGNVLVPDQHTNAVAGALHMGLYALPRMRPWIDHLAATCARDTPGASACAQTAAQVGAPWLRDVPWRRAYSMRSAADVESRLWTMALNTLPVRVLPLLPALDRIVANAGVAEAWQEYAAGVRSATTGIRLDAPRGEHVATALLMLSLRTAPEDFATWFQHASLSPSIGWSGALLCGLEHGYSKLPHTFRGTPSEQAFVATTALDATRAITGQPGLDWRGIPHGAPGAAVSGAGLELHAAGMAFLQRPHGQRSAWFEADALDGPAAHAAARRLAAERGWDCLPDGQLDTAEFLRHIASESAVPRLDEVLETGAGPAP